MNLLGPGARRKRGICLGRNQVGVMVLQIVWFGFLVLGITRKGFIMVMGVFFLSFFKVRGARINENSVNVLACLHG